MDYPKNKKRTEEMEIITTTLRHLIFVAAAAADQNNEIIKTGFCCTFMRMQMIILKAHWRRYSEFCWNIDFPQSIYCCVISQCPIHILSYLGSFRFVSYFAYSYFHFNLFLLFLLWNNHRHLRDKIKDKSIGLHFTSQCPRAHARRRERESNFYGSIPFPYHSSSKLCMIFGMDA